jgi:hypothetical protein
MVPPGSQDLDELAGDEARATPLRAGDTPQSRWRAKRRQSVKTATRPCRSCGLTRRIARAPEFSGRSRSTASSRLLPRSCRSRGCSATHPGAAYAHVAVGPTAVALAIVRDGILHFARELSDTAAPSNKGADRTTVAERLSIELEGTFVLVKQRNRLTWRRCSCAATSRAAVADRAAD